MQTCMYESSKVDGSMGAYAGLFAGVFRSVEEYIEHLDGGCEPL
jgi:hypothetical protein